MCAILAGILWGIISIFLKGLYAAGFSALQVMFFRGLFSSFFMAIFLFIKDKNLLKINFGGFVILLFTTGTFAVKHNLTAIDLIVGVGAVEPHR